MPEQVFVGRDHELARLDGMLSEALAGRGGTAFVAGEAGTGKSTLMQAFRRRATGQHGELLVASGRCTSAAGLGDPYLPWREVLGMATGMVAQDGGPAGGGEQRRRLLSRSVEVLLEVGPDLLGAIIPGAGLVAALGLALAPKDRLIGELGKRERRQAGATAAAAAIEPDRIVEQCSSVLLALAAEQPLLILLDDLHWVDAASAGLLFHLSQRVSGANLLLVGNYRPAEVALPGPNGRHPMEKVLSEVKRYDGDITIDLDGVGERDRHEFVDLLLDSEPNRFSPGFRERLLRLTGGHPLFTVELLRSLMERDDIVADADGRWVDSRELDWGSVPARVEGVLEERLARLDLEQREILDVGCVEGVSFSTGVVSRVLERPMRGVLRDLSVTLERQHRLVVEGPDDELAGGRFRFSHALVQRYLYDELGAATRRLTHAEIAGALQVLDDQDSGTLNSVLAHHFVQAGDAAGALPHLIASADAAARSGAPVESRDLYDQALGLLDGLTRPIPGADDLRWQVRRGLDAVLARIGDRAPREENARETLALASRSGREDRLAEALWLQVQFPYEDRDDTQLLAATATALPVARQADRQDLVARLLARWTTAAGWLGEPAAEVAAAATTAWEIATALDDDEVLLDVGYVLHSHYADYGETQQAMDVAMASAARARAVGDRHELGRTLANIGYQYMMLGRPDLARGVLAEALAACQAIGYQRMVGYISGNLALAHLYDGETGDAERLLTDALQLPATADDPFLAAATRHYLARTYERQGALAEALAGYRIARDEFDRAPGVTGKGYAMDCQAGMARCCLGSGDLAAALDHIAPVFEYMVDPDHRPAEFEAQNLWTAVEVFRATGDHVRELAAADAGRRGVLAQADRIQDLSWRSAFLANDPVHQLLFNHPGGVTAAQDEPDDVRNRTS